MQGLRLVFSECANNGHGGMALQAVVGDRGVGDVQGRGGGVILLTSQAGQTVGRVNRYGDVVAFSVCCEQREALGNKKA